MRNIKIKIVEFREDAQTLEKSRPSGSSSQSSKNNESNTSGANLVVPEFYVFYKEPKRDETCRTCGQLETLTTPRPDPRKELYEGHWSNYPTGCPQFCADERQNVYSC